MDHGAGPPGGAGRPVAGGPAAEVPGAAGEPLVLPVPDPPREARAAAREGRRQGHPLPERGGPLHEPRADMAVDTPRGGGHGVRGGRGPQLGHDGVPAEARPDPQGDGQGELACGRRLLPQPVHRFPAAVHLHGRLRRQHTGRAARHPGDTRLRGGHLVRPVVRDVRLRDRVPRLQVPAGRGLPHRHADRRLHRPARDVPEGAVWGGRLHTVQQDEAEPLQPERTDAVLQQEQGAEHGLHRVQELQDHRHSAALFRGSLLHGGFLLGEARGVRPRGQDAILLQAPGAIEGHLCLA
eukprot:464104-Hanusia_phi.AAC.5